MLHRSATQIQALVFREAREQRIHQARARATNKVDDILHLSTRSVVFQASVWRDCVDRKAEFAALGEKECAAMGTEIEELKEACVEAHAGSAHASREFIELSKRKSEFERSRVRRKHASDAVKQRIQPFAVRAKQLTMESSRELAANRQMQIELRRMRLELKKFHSSLRGRLAMEPLLLGEDVEELLTNLSVQDEAEDGASADAVVAASFAELNAALKRENYSRAVDICNKIRSKLPDDVDAVKVKCLALIRLEKFDKALELAVKYDFLSTEKAYCLYRLKQDDEALALLNGDLETQTTAQLHLAAQLHFRKGDYDQSIRIYELLLSHAQEGDDLLELQTNLLAAYASADRSEELKDREIPIDDGFEVAFNKSFVAIQSGDWAAAEDLLATAERLCRETFAAEGASEAEIEEEVAVIKTQLAFVKQMRGDLDGALSDYRNVLKIKLRNRAVGAVASNNIVAIRKDHDVLDSFKRLKNIDTAVLSEKLSLTQQEAILTNRTLLLCLLNKTEECRESLDTLKKKFPESKSIADIVVLLAIKDQSPAVAIEQLQGDVSVGGRLGLAHVYLTEGHVLKAAECIRSIEQLAHTPGTVATLVALYEEAGDPASAQIVLKSTLEHYRASDYTSEQAMKVREGDCWYKIQKKQYREAADAYLELLEGETAGALDRDLRLRSMASLVVALSFCDAEAAEARCTMLPTVEESGVDPSELEKEAPRSNRLAVKFAEDKKNERKRAAKSPESISRKRAKRREAYLTNLRARPDYNASIGLVNPDPERWIPRKQRSHGKRGRRGRNRFVGAQGAGMGTEKDALKLDAAARAARKAESDKPAAVVVTSGSGIRKSKKKKRR
ncbi:hypothetical protein BBO99_00002945 [Phytophthora kernoviae]|uniref:Signal recognition particle subunit SRP72 n=2 Tax=Phytophthora kernoviae TaxID=325452 RepID=A0A3R7G9F3_9STRA|nr:hypothetical protein G195_003987 [Phytophthora kernoviae 00238/432]KAG2527043.1 hypothetical protein JM16_002911 [Phytophthora kernoviae]KAG2530028.1 hypothetical protein JM18_002455 [Phytophthora kernoviae]RLN43901.1 hypothetical protein BBI17_002846 [Phytophthora kernoviae]RLN82390.1 hypothetical protein BBO99_00002945 [Phytophthora kernoviae]